MNSNILKRHFEKNEKIYILLYTDNTIDTFPLEKSLTFTEAADIIGCKWIEHHYLDDTYSMLIDEEPNSSVSFNKEASKLVPHLQFICGTVIVLPTKFLN